MEMKCYNHIEADAVGICKNCYKAVCKQCLIPNEYDFIVCSTSCLEEVIALQKMTDKAKMAYGLQAGRFPVTVIFTGLAGIFFTSIGILAWIGGGFATGIFMLGIGIIFVIAAFFYWLNQRKSGLRV
jgi:hypothetical protein